MAEAARSLDICETLLRSWKLAFEKQADQAFQDMAASPLSRRNSASFVLRTNACNGTRHFKKSDAFFAREVL